MGYSAFSICIVSTDNVEKFNFDGSIVKIAGASEGFHVFVEKYDPNEGPVASSECQMSTAIFIKLMAMIASSGHKGPQITVIAIKEMPDGQFFPKCLRGLRHVTDSIMTLIGQSMVGCMSAILAQVVPLYGNISSR